MLSNFLNMNSHNTIYLTLFLILFCLENKYWLEHHLPWQYPSFYKLTIGIDFLNTLSIACIHFESIKLYKNIM